jgi:hypothetical protein
MLSKLWVENFKAFGPDQTIDLAPITIIFGPNDAGKSSILQAMHVMADTNNITRNFKELVHQKETDRNITVGFQEQHRSEEGIKSLGGLRTTYGWDGSQGEKLQSDVYGQDLKLSLHKSSDKIEIGDSDLGIEEPWIAGCHIVQAVTKELEGLPTHWSKPDWGSDGEATPFGESRSGPGQLLAYMAHSGLQWTPHYLPEIDKDYSPLDSNWFRIAVTGLYHRQLPEALQLWDWSSRDGEPFSGNSLGADGGYGEPGYDYVDSVLLALLRWLEEECQTVLLFMKIRSDVLSLKENIVQGIAKKIQITTDLDEDGEAARKEFGDLWFQRVQQMLLNEDWNKDWKWGEYNLKMELGKMALWTHKKYYSCRHMPDYDKENRNADWNTIPGLENLHYIALGNPEREKSHNIMKFGPCPADELLDVERVEYALDLTRKAISWIEKKEDLRMSDVIDSILPCYDPAKQEQFRDFPRNEKTGDLWGVEERFPQIIEKIDRESTPKNSHSDSQHMEVSSWLSYLINKDRALSTGQDEEGHMTSGLRSPDGVTISLEQSGRGIQEIIPKLKKVLDRKIVQTHEYGSYHDYFENPEPVLWMEEPEAHLHPKSQARLADALIYGALNLDVDQPESDKDAKNKVVPKQIIVETHSEHILTRLLRRVRETTNNTGGRDEDKEVPLPAWTDVRPEDICILYVDPAAHSMDGTASVIKRLEIGNNGELLTPFPDGFFQSELNDRLKGYPTT